MKRELRTPEFFSLLRGFANATDGSTLITLRAGRYAASNPVTVTNPQRVASTTGFRALVLYKKMSAARVLMRERTALVHRFCRLIRVQIEQQASASGNAAPEGEG